MKLTPEEIRRVAEAYAGQIICSVHFTTDVTLSNADQDRILTAVHDQLVEAWIAGYTAGSNDPQEAA